MDGCQRQSITSVLSEKSKTPVTRLDELCAKRRIQPVYELLESDDSAFVLRVTAGDCSAVGKGVSKKKAKHNAASLLLTQVSPDISAVTVKNNPQDYLTSSGLYPAAEEPEANYIGELQELSQQNLWPLPVYECYEDHGVAQGQLFKCRVGLLSLVETGVGRSKKKAKQAAAEKLLSLVKNNLDIETLSSPNSLENFGDPHSQTLGQLQTMVSSLKLDRKIETLTPTDSVEISKFYQGLKYRTGKTLASLQVLALNMPATNYCQMLQEIAEEQHFEVVYANIPDLTITGYFQCLIQLSCKPVAVCQGVGLSKDAARSNAAHNALQYLKIMTRKLVK